MFLKTSFEIKVRFTEPYFDSDELVCRSGGVFLANSDTTFSHTFPTFPQWLSGTVKIN